LGRWVGRRRGEGLDEIPKGPQRALECDKRHAEIMEGVGQILRIDVPEAHSVAYVEYED